VFRPYVTKSKSNLKSPTFKASHMQNEDLTRINRICEQFESHWKTGEAPLVDKFIGDTEKLDRSLLEEILKLDVFYRLKNNREVVAGNYAVCGPVAVEIAKEILASKASDITIPPESGQESDSTTDAPSGQRTLPRFKSNLNAKLQSR
jgi:hypothetical protein